MNRLLAVLLATMFFLSGCAQRALTEKEFNIIWGEYLQRELEESFDEKQSIAQREKILKEICSKYTIDYDMLKQYMMKSHKDTYQKLFLNQ